MSVHFAAIRSVRELLIPFFRQPSGDFADRLSSRATVMILGLFSAILMTSHYWGEPINCWVPAEYPTGWEKFVNQYCYVHGTYFVPMDKPLPWEPDIRRQVPIVYYQWVPYLLAVQAIMFYLPRIFWKSLCKFSALDIAGFTRRYSQLWSDIQEINDGYNNRLKLIKTVTVAQFWDSMRLYRKRRPRLTLPICYLISKTLHTINAGMQWILLNEFLSSKRYSLWGFSILKDLSNGEDWQYTGHFPRLTHCDFTRRRPASFQLDTVLCVLTLNLYYEKIFLFLWFWLAAVCLINFISTLQWLWVLCLPQSQRKFIKRYLFAVPNEETQTKGHEMVTSNNGFIEKSPTAENPGVDLQRLTVFTDEFLGLDGIFIIRVIADNVGELPAAYLTRSLYESAKEKSEMYECSTVMHKSTSTSYCNDAYLKSPKPSLLSGRMSGKELRGSSIKGAKEV